MPLVKPKKFLGQHFLKDFSIAQAIADTVDIDPSLPVLEVGPGMGVLTQFLLTKGRPLNVVEIDFESVAYLRQHYPALQHLQPDLLQDAGVQGPNPLLHGHDPERSGRTNGGRSGKQDLRHTQRTYPSLVQSGVPLHRARACVQSASQSEKRGNPNDPERDHRLG